MAPYVLNLRTVAIKSFLQMTGNRFLEFVLFKSFESSQFKQNFKWNQSRWMCSCLLYLYSFLIRRFNCTFLNILAFQTTFLFYVFLFYTHPIELLIITSPLYSLWAFISFIVRLLLIIWCIPLFSFHILHSVFYKALLFLFELFSEIQ